MGNRQPGLGLASGKYHFLQDGCQGINAGDQDTIGLSTQSPRCSACLAIPNYAPCACKSSSYQLLPVPSGTPEILCFERTWQKDGSYRLVPPADKTHSCLSVSFDPWRRPCDRGSHSRYGSGCTPALDNIIVPVVPSFS